MRRYNPALPSLLGSHSEPPSPDLFLRLRDPTERDRTGLYVAHGLRFLIQALGSEAPIHSVTLCPSLLIASVRDTLLRRLKQRAIPIYITSHSACPTLNEGGEPSAVVMAIRQHWTTLPTCLKRDDLWIGVEHLRTPGNVGTLMRSAAATGATGFMIFGPARDRTDPFDPTTVRATMGAIFGLRLVKTSHREFRTWRERSALTVLGATGEAAVDYRTVKYGRPIMLMLGNERSGLSKAQRTSCDEFVKIPMVNGIDSLNVAMAGTVLVYEVYSQRHPTQR